MGLLNMGKNCFVIIFIFMELLVEYSKLDNFDLHKSEIKIQF